MWIFLSDSFLSIVQDTNNPDNLLVRARKKGDINRVFPAAIEEVTAGRDYAYRTSLHRDAVVVGFMQAADDIDYPNFKDSVKDNARHLAYLRVWTEMWKWQEDIAVRRPRKFLKDETVKCPRAKSDMTPCVVQDGPVAYAMDAADRPICAGCEKGPRVTGVPLP